MNTNIYSPPKTNAPTNSQTKLGIGAQVVWSFAIIFTAILYRGIYKMPPAFEKTFTAFGTDLPAATQLFLKIYPVFFWPSIVSLCPLAFWLVNLFSEKYALLIIKISKYNLWLALFCFAMSIISLYLPLFTMSEGV